MPYAPQRGCQFEGCPKRAVTGSAYCAEHKALMEKHYEQFSRGYKANESHIT
ncbi:hypothetical protein [Selenomonas bovis]|uniref:hypothetical protein n=1 Tax=Selenomonas bovis TaxID=416586 RepID=UPI0003608298|nr:hypothetical protein [Selenomonas bovis]